MKPMNKSPQEEVLSVSRDRVARAAFAPRQNGPTVRRATRRSEVDALLAIIDLLEKEPTTVAAFDALVAAVRSVIAFDVMAIAEDEGRAPLVSCAPGLEELRPHAIEVVAAARRYFSGEGSLDEYVALTKSAARSWISLPLPTDSVEILGLMTVASSAALGEKTLALLACVARHIARTVAEGRRRPEGEVGRGSGGATIDLTKLLDGDSTVGRADALERLTRVAADLLAGGCAVDFEERGHRCRVVHAPGISESAISVLDRFVARAVAEGAMVRADGQAPMREGWLVAAPIVVENRAIGAFTAFGERGCTPELSNELVERFARGAGKTIARTLRAEDTRAMVRERDRMLSTVSHDLQNPLGVILMSAAYLLEGMPLDDRRRAGRAQVEAIHRNAHRMKRLVADLLDFESIEAGRMAMAPQAIRPRTLIDTAIEDMTLAADAAGVTLGRAPLARLPLVWADMERIVQVLLNLLTNAVKFTPRGGRVTVHARRTSETEVTFFVQDTGVGISPEELPHVFERHWQSPSSGVVRKKGSGLGLAICKSLVELSRGHIAAQSRSGRGTTMMFSLPIATGGGSPE